MYCGKRLNGFTPLLGTARAATGVPVLVVLAGSGSHSPAILLYVA